jgi:hypothetical protein
MSLSPTLQSKFNPCTNWLPEKHTYTHTHTQREREREKEKGNKLRKRECLQTCKD